MTEPGGQGGGIGSSAPDNFDLYARLGAGVLALIHADFTIVVVQPTDGMLLGRPAADLTGSSVLDLVHPEDRAIGRRHLRRLTDGTAEQVDAIEIRLSHVDGSWRWVQVSARALPGSASETDPAGPGTVAALVHDITERRLAEDRLRTSEGRFRALVERSMDIYVVVRGDGEVTYTSPSVETVLGWMTDEFAGLNRQLVHPDDLDRADQVSLTAVGPGQGRGRSFRLRHRDGSWRWFQAVGVDLSQDPRVAGTAYTLRPTIAPESAWARQRNRRLLAIAEATTSLVVLVEPGLEGVYFNPVARRFFGLAGDRPDRFDPEPHLPGESLGQWREEVVPAVMTVGHWQGEVVFRNADGHLVPLQVELMAHLGASGRTEVFSGVGVDVSDRKDLQARLEHAATHDHLTGLPNRALFVDRLQGAIGRSRRTRRPPAVLFCDLDQFKLINDRYGHAIGDQVLVELAQRLLATVRPGDAVARFGGDEFVMLCEDLSDETEAQTIARRVAGALNGRVTVEDRELAVSASIGVAYRPAPVTPQDLLRHADLAMYGVKHQDRTERDSERPARTRDRPGIAADLRTALDEGELAVYYQPQISLATGRVAGAEALLRWCHPSRGLLRPAQFLSVAEETGQLGPIGRWVAGEACRATQRLQRLQPRGGAGLLISLNLSASQFADHDLTVELDRVLTDTQLAPGRVSVEIQRDLLAGSGTIASSAARLRGLGVQLSVDDVAAGEQVEEQLRRFPVDLLKVDPLLVARLGGSDDASEVKAVVDLAHHLGIRPVAKGVESAVQLAELRRFGCDLAQGYFIAHPMPEQKLADLLVSAPMWWVFDSGGRSGVWSGWRS